MNVIQPLTEAQRERFWSKVEKSDTCWRWGGGISPDGYGSFYLSSRLQAKAHRVAYSDVKGAIPEGKQLDHLCRNRACVNPDHLEPVTGRENTLRGDTIPARYVKRDACKAGHPYVGDNVFISVRGTRACRTCNRINKQRHRDSVGGYTTCASCRHREFNHGEGGCRAMRAGLGRTWPCACTAFVPTCKGTGSKPSTTGEP